MVCPICASTLAVSGPDASGRDITLVDCSHCGKFGLSGSLPATLPTLLERRDASAKLSHILRKADDSGQRLVLNTMTAEAILQQPLPRPREQADVLIKWLAINSPGPGEPIRVDYDMHGAVVGAKSHAGFAMLVDHLKSTGLVSGSLSSYLSGEFMAEIALSFAGWDHYESLRLGGISYRKAFMAMKFGDTRLNSFLENVLRPAAARAGFDLFKLEDRPQAGLIDDRMRVEIRSSDFLVADLSHDNLGAYWEAGYAEGLGKPVIYTCEKAKFEHSQTHFDTNHHLTIVWDLAAPDEAAERLTQTVRATLPHLARLTDA